MIPGNTRHWGAIKPLILERLTQAGGDFVRTMDLIDHVWTSRGIKQPNLPEIAVNREMRKLRKLGFQIIAQRGCGSPGYRILPAESPP